MKNALKIAFPTVLAIVLGWLAIEAIKEARKRYHAEKQAKALRAQQSAQLAADADQNDEG